MPRAKVTPDRLLDLSIKVLGFPLLMMNIDFKFDPPLTTSSYFGGPLAERSIRITEPSDAESYAKFQAAAEKKWPGFVPLKMSPQFVPYRGEVLL